MTRLTDVVRSGSIALLIGVVALTLVASVPAAAQQNSTSTAQTQITDCANPDVPEMDQARLYSPQKTITADQPGKIAGGFKLDNTQDCPVVVSVTLTVPSGMEIAGGSDWQSAGAGLVTTQFTLGSGSQVKSLSANVYSQNTGDRAVTGNVEYWVEGHSDTTSREIDGLSLSFDVQETNTGGSTPTPSGSGSDSGGSDSGGSDSGNSGDSDWPFSQNITLILGVLVLAALAIIGMMYVAADISIGLGLSK